MILLRGSKSNHHEVILYRCAEREGSPAQMAGLSVSKGYQQKKSNSEELRRGESKKIRKLTAH
jgi:hypothetical protein